MRYIRRMWISLDQLCRCPTTSHTSQRISCLLRSWTPDATQTLHLDEDTVWNIETDGGILHFLNRLIVYITIKLSRN